MPAILLKSAHKFTALQNANRLAAYNRRAVLRVLRARTALAKLDGGK